MILLENTGRYVIGRVYPCVYCKKVKFVMMQTKTGSVLPVECDKNGIPPAEEEFDPKIHRSHLVYCPNKKERAEAWKGIVEEMKKQYWLNEKQHIKEVLR